MKRLMIALAVLTATVCAGEGGGSFGGEMSFDLTQMTNYRTEMRQTTERNCAKLPNAMDAFGDNMIYYSPK